MLKGHDLDYGLYIGTQMKSEEKKISMGKRIILATI